MVVIEWIAFIYIILCAVTEFVKIFIEKEVAGRIANFMVFISDLLIAIILFKVIFGSL